MRIGIALVVLWLASCVQSSTVTCADGTICRDGTVCAPAGGITLCVTPEQLAACDEIAERGSCGVDQGTHRCYPTDDRLVCLPIGCGNHFLDTEEREQCDDGNNTSDDGCSADCLSNERCGNGIVDPLRGERCDDSNFVSHDGCSSRCDLESATWVETMVEAYGGVLFGASATYDVRRGRFVVFGGGAPGPQGSTVYSQKTSEWEPGGWVVSRTPSAPAGRLDPSFAYDETRGVSVLFGGVQDSLYFADTWEWTGSFWRSIDADGPSPRAGAAMAYDPIRDRMVLFGGQSKDELADTWALQRSPTSGQLEWIELAASGPPPTPAPTMTFDPVAGVIALVAKGEQWELHDTTWMRIGAVPGMPALPMRIVFDTGLGQRVLAATEGSRFSQWAWDGQAWIALARATLATFDVRAFVADRVRGGVLAVMDGGIAYWNTAGQLQTIADRSSFDPRADGSSAVNDLRRRLVLLFGGNRGSRAAPELVADSYSFDGFVLDRLVPAASPSPRWEHAMAYDIARDRVVLFGGDQNNGAGTDIVGDTWLWDGTTWTKVTPPMSPPPRAGHSMAYDADRQRVVLFGGVDEGGVLGDTWEWDGTTWMPAFDSGISPTPRTGASLAHDPIGGGILLFGGGEAVDHRGLQDTWRLTASGWAQVPLVVLPPPRMRATLTWSPARRRLVLAGGESLFEFGIVVRQVIVPDVWEFDGSRWRALPETPRAVSGHVGFFMPDGGGVATLGGYHVDVIGTQGMYEYRWTDRGAYETCSSRADADGDGLAACDDPDCWSYCSPQCMPGETCATASCGDSTCSPLETSWRCEEDCGPPPIACGDVVCDTGETCAAECP